MFNGYLPENVTFKDGDTLNTRIENLIEATHNELHYRDRIHSNNKTGVKGVFFDKRTNKYVAHISKNRSYLKIGYYNTVEEAEKARKEAENNEKLYGKFLDKCKVVNG